MAESEICAICEDANRDASKICVVEHVPDLIAIDALVLGKLATTC